MRAAHLLARLETRWRDYWFATLSPYPLAAFRILFGSYLLLYFLQFLGRVELHFSAQGVYLPLLVPDYSPGATAARLLYVVTLAALSLFTLGYRTRWVTPALVGLYLHHWLLQLGATFYAYDRLNIILLTLLCFANLDGAWALHRSNAPVLAWPVRMIRWEMAVMYFGSGLYKALNPLWHNGELLFWTWSGSWGTPASFWLVQMDWPMWVYTSLAWSVIALELAIGPLLLWRRTCIAAIALGTAFHVANWVLLGIPEFMSCVATYALFLPPEHLERVTRLAAWRSRVRAPSLEFRPGVDTST